ncbi:hypothetical protein ACHAQJ_002477 [Trichoderma viride]
MPISRKKTCTQCRKAKTRCSLTLPRCTRCIDKSLSCEYVASTIPRIAPYSVSGDLRDGTTELRALAAKEGHQHGVHPGCALVDTLDMMTSSPPLSSDAPVMAPAGNHSDTWSAALQVDLGAGTGLDTTYTMGPIEPCHGAFTFINAINMNGLPTPDDAINDEDTRLRNSITGSGTQSDFLVHDKSACVFANRRGLTANAVLATRTILGQYESYDLETLVESMQALTVYLLLQAQDPGSLIKNDVKFLLITLMDIGSKLHLSLDYNTSIGTLDNPLNRTTWVLHEATRRTLCLLYIIEMFLEVNFRHDESRCCQVFASSPLPCVRELWEVPSTYEWKKRYSEFLRGRAVEKVLTLADYKMSEQLPAEELMDGSSIGEGCGGVTKDVMRWCEGLDQFGTLVTLAAALIKYELGPLANGSGGYAKIT